VNGHAVEELLFIMLEAGGKIPAASGAWIIDSAAIMGKEVCKFFTTGVFTWPTTRIYAWRW